MPRPKKSKNICRVPDFECFKSEPKSENIINMTVEEYEVIRLIDKENLNQEECSKRMNVSRPSIQLLYSQARGKIAQFLCNGGTLQIEGGNYEVCKASKYGCNGFTQETCNCGTSGCNLTK